MLQLPTKQQYQLRTEMLININWIIIFCKLQDAQKTKPTDLYKRHNTVNC